jgi:hypothetical protein
VLTIHLTKNTTTTTNNKKHDSSYRKERGALKKHIKFTYKHTNTWKWGYCSISLLAEWMSTTETRAEASVEPKKSSPHKPGAWGA